MVDRGENPEYCPTYNKDCDIEESWIYQSPVCSHTLYKSRFDTISKGKKPKCPWYRTPLRQYTTYDFYIVRPT